MKREARLTHQFSYIPSTVITHLKRYVNQERMKFICTCIGFPGWDHKERQIVSHKRNNTTCSVDQHSVFTTNCIIQL